MAPLVPLLDYTRHGHDGFAQQTQGVFKKELVEKLEQGEKLPIWSGEELTLNEQLTRMHEHARKYAVAEDGFKKLYTYKGVTCEINPNLTKAVNGDGYFRLKGKVKISPSLFLALVQDNQKIGLIDPTVVYMKDLAVFDKQITAPAVNGYSRLCYWCNRVVDPILSLQMPLKHRDGVDLTSFHKDDDGTYWFTSQSLLSPSENVLGKNPKAVRALDTYFVYRLKEEEQEDGSKVTDVVLISQTIIGGYVPKMFINRVVGKVLTDYVQNVERMGLQMEKDGTLSSYDRLNAIE